MKDRVESVLTIALCLILIAVPGLWLYDALYGSWLDVPVEAGPEPERARPTTYQVMPGDTIWSIYLELYEGCDWEEVRLKIGQANGLRNDTLYPYEIIKLPEVSR